MPFLRRNTAPPPNLPVHNYPPGVPSRYFDWVATATSVIWTEQDEWKKQYRMVKYSASEHNRPFTEMLRERNGYDCPEISFVMDRHPSTRGERETLCVEAFCQGADLVLDGIDPTELLGHQLANVDEPKAWISDRNYWLLRDIDAENPLYENVLGRLEFYRVLQNERFREGPSGEMIGPIRNLFVSNPDGTSVMAILKTANQFQAPALHELFASYITTSPTPSIKLKLSDFWNTSYVISFTLPFYAIGLSGRQDKRTLHDPERKFRARYLLDSLNIQELSPLLGHSEDSCLEGKLVLHEGVYSFATTGVTEEHWTAYCFDDDFFESEPRLLEEGEELESSEGFVDPIIVEVEVKDTAIQWRPRQYSLVALAIQLDKIHGHHARIHDVFKHSLDSYTPSTRYGPSRNLNPSNKQDWKQFPELLSKVTFYNTKIIEEVENFLENDVQLSSVSVPQGELWQSLRSDVKALKALRAIEGILKELKDIGDKLEETKRSFKELRREKKLDRADEQQIREERSKELAVAAVVIMPLLSLDESKANMTQAFAILSLVAQVYSGKPQKGDEESWPGYLFLVSSFIVICAAGILYMLRKHVALHGKALLAKFNGFLTTTGLDLRYNSMISWLLQKATLKNSQSDSLLSSLNTITETIVAMAVTTCSVSGIETLLGKAGLDTPIPEYPGADIVHNPQDIFRVYLAETIQKLTNCDRLVAYDAIQTSNVTGMGDLVVVAPRLRLKDVNNEDLAKDLLQKLPRLPPFGCPIRDGIRLQVFFSPNTLSRLSLFYISDRNVSYGYDTSLGLTDPAVPDGQKKKVIVEYSSPNMASEFQVSHLRSTLLGTYVANIHASMGCDVVRMNYLGDWGKQIGLLAAGWRRFGSEDEFAKQPLRHLLQVKHKIEELFKPEVEKCKATKANDQDTSEIESQGLYAERDDFFKKMEDKDPEAIALWQRFRDATVKDLTDSYARLGVTFDEYSGESQVTSESVAEVEQALKEKGVYEEHDDSWQIDFSKHEAKGLSIAVLRYRNGTTSYLLRDVAAVLDRFKAHSFDKMIYVAAMEQEMHFNRVIKTLKLMDRQDLADRIQHTSFAKINGLPEELKGAELLSDYLDGCRSMVQADLEEEDEEVSHVDSSERSVDILGLAGLFVQDHYHKRNTSYTSDAKKMAPLEGETGAAIQNCYARLLKKLGPEPTTFDYTTLNYTSLESEDYAELLRILLQYPDAAHGSFKSLEPSFIVVYLLRLVDQLMVTLDDDDMKDWAGQESASEARLALYENARQVFENALKLLGVTPWSL
ncbi:unnamed protein product [Fusarium graminearum]|nr:unnamed protein product [Fusarium graminearum]